MEVRTFDVIIPVFRPGKTFSLLLSSLHHQTKQPGHIFILHTCREGETLPAAEKYGDITICPVRRADFDHGGTRRYGASLSSADVLVFMTQDAIPQDDTLFEHLLAAFSDEQTAAAYARQLPKKGLCAEERYARTFNYPDKSGRKTKADLPQYGIKTFFCSDVCAAYRRDRYEEAGGFPAPVIFNEDMILAHRLIDAGYAIRYQADAMVVHSHSYSPRQQFHRYFDNGVSQADHPEVFSSVRTETEGEKLVARTCRYLFSSMQGYRLIPFGITCVAKYAGFALGKRYQKLSHRLILSCTGNPVYWKRVWKQ